MIGDLIAWAAWIGLVGVILATYREQRRSDAGKLARREAQRAAIGRCAHRSGEERRP